MQTASHTYPIHNSRLFLIDAATAAAAQVRDAANDIPGVIHVQAPNPYVEDPLYCQLYVLARSEVTEKELDDILWTRNVDYVGVAEMIRH